ncbi:hypothetical protein B5E84_00455 [Lachnoclostridium sp. An14]|uniref:RadC family protein n=1 Tax=Lachnoclostridium sp. An14 TaxID=1965562 RepID=UPI000B376C4D|nr:DNA repair protein RadC [Lachnoclostridium sp. An14]OUQ21769.1 hypothetical protein B5E84_00455 [Lachnoclostridium sp. An14]
MSEITMKELPLEERPYEKCFTHGPEALSDAELLSVIIRTGTKKDSSLALSRKILEGEDGGLLSLLHRSLPELMEIRGIGPVKASQLLCIGELSRRIWRQAASGETLSFHSPEAIAGYYMEEMRHREQEELRAMFFNTKQVLIKELLVSRGTVNASLATPREIFIEALRYRAVSLILVHNHPSGDPSPSREDVAFTKRVRLAGEVVGIALLDHIIIGDNAFMSLKERGML